MYLWCSSTCVRECLFFVCVRACACVCSLCCRTSHFHSHPSFQYSFSSHLSSHLITPLSLSPPLPTSAQDSRDHFFQQQWGIPSTWSRHMAIPCLYQVTFNLWPTMVELMILSHFTGMYLASAVVGSVYCVSSYVLCGIYMVFITATVTLGWRSEVIVTAVWMIALLMEQLLTCSLPPSSSTVQRRRC